MTDCGYGWLVDVENKRIKSRGFWRRLQPGRAVSVAEGGVSTYRGGGAGVGLSAEGKGNGKAVSTAVGQRVEAGAEKGKHGGKASASVDKPPSSGSEDKDGQTTSQPPSGSQKPKHRRFRLAGVSPSTSPKMCSENGVRKRRKPPKAVSAVFVETDGLSRLVSDKTGDPSVRKAAHDASNGSVNSKIHKSRNEESPATILNKSEPTEDFPSIETLKLAAELQQYAFRETGDAPTPSGPMGDYPEHFSTSGLPSDSQGQKEIRESGMSHAAMGGDFVYDTYLHYRHQSPLAAGGQAAMSLNDLLQELPPESVGVLLLADDDAITIDIPNQDDPDEEAFDIDDDDENGTPESILVLSALKC